MIGIYRFQIGIYTFQIGFNSLHDGFLLSAEIFKISFFKKNLSGIPSGCQTVLIQIRPYVFVWPDLGPNCFQRPSADDTWQRKMVPGLL